MFRNEVEGVRNYFHENSYHVSIEWLEECISWVMNNQPPNERTLPKLRDFAYQQWLLADLREASSGCLPPNLKNQKHIVLPGKYTVQAQQFVDIANPFYTQLKFKREGVLHIENNDNNDTDENNTELTQWGKGPKSKGPSLRPRKLKLTLCDGKQEIFGLEFRSLPAFKGKILPGVKLQITGPVDCRRGMLLLEPKNVKILGGEIDTMLVSNAPENIIARILAQPENPDPYKDLQNTVPEPRTEIPTNKFSSSSRCITQNDSNAAKSVVPRQPAQTSTQISLQTSQNKSVVQNRPINQTRHIPQNDNMQHSNQNTRTSSMRQQTTSFDFDDDFDLTEVDLLELAEKEAAGAQQQSLNNTVTNVSFEDDDFDNELLDIDLDQLENQALQSAQSNISHTRNSQLFNKPQQQNHQSKLMPDNKKQQSNAYFEHDDEFDYDLLDIDLDNINSNISVSTSLSNQPKNSISNQFKVSNNSSSTTSCAPESLNQVLDNLEYSNRLGVQKKIPVNSSNKCEQPPLKKLKGDQCDSISFTSIQNDVKKTEKPNLSKFLEKTSSKAKEPMKPKKISGWPFVYLLQLQDSPPARAIVKACVITALTKLKMAEGLWNLEVRIGDGSANLDVSLSNQVLESLIGFSVSECESLKLAAKENIHAKIKVTESLQNLKKKLIDLICLMVIEFSPDKKPYVTEFQDLTENHLKELSSRSLSI